MKIEIQLVFSQFSISSWSEKGHEPSQAELKILQLGSDSSQKIRKIFAWESTYPKEIIEFWVLD